MSLSRFGTQKSKLEEFIIKMDRELAEEFTTGTIQDRMALNKKRCQRIMEFSRNNHSEVNGIPKRPQNYNNLEFIRQGMNRSLINVPLEALNDKELKEMSGNDIRRSVRFSHTPRKTGSRLKSSGGKGNKPAPEKANVKGIKKFSVSGNSFKQIEDARKRNSAVLKNFGGGKAIKPSRFAPKINTIHTEEQRDSIDVSTFEEKNNVMQQLVSGIFSNRESMFKFDKLDTLVYKETEDKVDDIYSDLSDCDFDAREPEIIETKDLVEEGQDTLRIHYIQHLDNFLISQKRTIFNIHMDGDDGWKEEFRDDSTMSSKLFWFNELDTEMAVSLFACGSTILTSLPAVLNSTQERGLFRLPERDLCSVMSGKDGWVELHRIEAGDLSGINTSDQARYEKGLSYISSAFSNESQLPRFGLSLLDASVISHRLNPEFLKKYAKTDQSLSIRSANGAVEVKARCNNDVFFNLELGRQESQLLLAKGRTIFFNDVDGIEVKNVLSNGYSDEELEAFLPKSPNYWLDCINRHPCDKALVKLLGLKAFLKDEDVSRGNIQELLNEIYKKVSSSTEKISKFIDFQRKYLLNKVKEERPSLLRLSIFRNYKQFDMKKEIAEIVLFYAAPIQHEEGAVISTVLNSSVFRDCNVMTFGTSVQRELPDVQCRQEFEKTNPFLNIDVSYDCMIGYSPESNEFFFIADSNLGTKKGYHLKPSSIVGNDNDYRGLLKVMSEGDRQRDIPKEGPWIGLSTGSTSILDTGALMYTSPDVFRAYACKFNYSLLCNP